MGNKIFNKKIKLLTTLGCIFLFVFIFGFLSKTNAEVDSSELPPAPEAVTDNSTTTATDINLAATDTPEAIPNINLDSDATTTLATTTDITIPTSTPQTVNDPATSTSVNLPRPVHNKINHISPPAPFQDNTNLNNTKNTDGIQPTCQQLATNDFNTTLDNARTIRQTALKDSKRSSNKKTINTDYHSALQKAIMARKKALLACHRK